jgi:hypothetical protein
VTIPIRLILYIIYIAPIVSPNDPSFESPGQSICSQELV